MNLDALGLGHKEFRALRAQGLQTVQNVLEAGPEAFAKRKKMWSELSEALRKVANHRPNQAEEIATFLKAGDELSEAHHSARAEQRATDPDAHTRVTKEDDIAHGERQEVDRARG